MFGELPVLAWNDTFYETGNVIMEVIATEADKQGKGRGSNKFQGEPAETPIVRAIAEAAAQCQRDTLCHRTKGDAPADVKDKCQKWFTLFQDQLIRNDDGNPRTDEWMFGEHYTWGDIAVFEAVNACSKHHGSAMLRSFPKLKEFHDNVAGNSRISMRLGSRGD
eukprot:UC1_evm1s263